VIFAQNSGKYLEITVLDSKIRLGKIVSITGDALCRDLGDNACCIHGVLALRHGPLLVMPHATADLT